MTTTTQAKICGITSIDALQAAGDAGAAFAGLVFHPASPRCISYEQARSLVAHKPAVMRCVGLFADPPIERLDTALSHVNLDMIQLHGSETPEYASDIRAHTGVSVMKALPIANAQDVDRIADYEGVCDWLLFDAKPAIETDNPGGHGKAFDWTLLKNVAPACPWMLAGGLNAANVRDALECLAPDAVDVSSGVEAVRGRKDPQMIAAFINTVDKVRT
jgi:phosphoribosylanthranilate isomerase